MGMKYDISVFISGLFVAGVHAKYQFDLIMCIFLGFLYVSKKYRCVGRLMMWGQTQAAYFCPCSWPECQAHVLAAAIIHIINNKPCNKRREC